MKKIITSALLMVLSILSLAFITPSAYAVLTATDGIHISTYQDEYYIMYQGNRNIEPYLWNQGIQYDFLDRWENLESVYVQIYKMPSFTPVASYTATSSSSIFQSTAFNSALGQWGSDTYINIRLDNIMLDDGGQVDPQPQLPSTWLEHEGNRAYIHGQMYADHGDWDGEGYGDLQQYFLTTDDEHWFDFWGSDYDFIEPGNHVDVLTIENPDESRFIDFKVFIRIGNDVVGQEFSIPNKIVEKVEYYPLTTRINWRMANNTGFRVYFIDGTSTLIDFFGTGNTVNTPKVEIMMYFEKILSPDDFSEEDWIQVNNISQLPNTSGTLQNANDLASVGYVFFDENQNNANEVRIIVNNTPYKMQLSSLPGTGVNELNQRPLSPGIYYSEQGKKVIYYEFKDSSISNQKIAFLEESTINGFRSYAEINLTDQTYNFTTKLSLYGVVYDGGQGKAFLDVLFPFDLDDLLAIEIQYQHRWQILWNWWTEWSEPVVTTRYINEYVDMRSTWQHVKWLFTPFGYYEFYAEEVPSWFSGGNATISEINNVDNNYKLAYLNKVNDKQTASNLPTISMNDLFNGQNSVYRVYLNTFNDGRYTNWAVKDNIAIMNVTYAYQGVVYDVPFPDIEFVGVGGQGEPDAVGNAMQDFWEWINQFGQTGITVFWIVVVVVAIIAVLYVINMFNSLFGTPKRYGYGSKQQNRTKAIIAVAVVAVIIVILLAILGVF